ncbi:prenyltransferase/squalene oxidase repeat-containing protein [Streptomyces tauricus]|uniref:prenyltransferase/squalene oxidase repeat-containing protein n=1 Tax=Streptomyces tauricus TaxID=68274 RepID=UPI0034458932
MATQRAPGWVSDAQPHFTVSLVLMQQDGNAFYLVGGSGSKQCPQVTIKAQQLRRTDLRTAVVDAAKSQLHVDLSYVGVIAVDQQAEGPSLVVAASTGSVDGVPSGQDQLTLYRLPDLAHLTGALPDADAFELALHQRSAEAAAGNLGVRIRKSIDISLDYLDANVCTEGTLKGWNQYQDGSRIGVISTAQALLAHVHADSRDDVVEESARTLESLQNPDGGWQVRRALVGATSEVSITESTAFCLQALRAAGRTDSNAVVQNGLRWLQDMQRPDGGWDSSSNGQASHVVATALATRVLVAFKRTDHSRRGADWLRAAQNVDGGWGPIAMPQSQQNTESNSSPAYTAHALIALRATGTDPGERLIGKACEFLDAKFDAEREEPWASTSFTTLVDPESYARLDFRHFATPWAIVALTSVGRDLSDKTILLATLRLLHMQRPDGPWRSGLTAPEAFPVWACHDALFALRSVLTASAERLESIVLATYLANERRTLEESLTRLFFAPPTTHGRVRGYFNYAWMSLLTVFVALLFLSQFSLIEAPSHDSKVLQIGKWAIASLIAALGALAPPILSEEYKLWRQRKISRNQGGEAS